MNCLDSIHSLIKNYWASMICQALSSAGDWERRPGNKTRLYPPDLTPYPTLSMTLRTPFILVTCAPRNTYTLLTSTLKEPSTWDNKTDMRKGHWVGVGKRISFIKEHNQEGLERYMHMCICTHICSYTYIRLKGRVYLSFFPLSRLVFPRRARKKI